MWCNICGKYFTRGTTTLPNDYCNECLNKGYIQFIEVKKTTKEIIDHYNNVIKIHENNIKKYEKEIIKSKEIIEFAKKQMSIVD